MPCLACLSTRLLPFGIKLNKSKSPILDTRAIGLTAPHFAPQQANSVMPTEAWETTNQPKPAGRRADHTPLVISLSLSPASSSPSQVESIISLVSSCVSIALQSRAPYRSRYGQKIEGIGARYSVTGRERRGLTVIRSSPGVVDSAFDKSLSADIVCDDEHQSTESCSSTPS